MVNSEESTSVRTGNETNQANENTTAGERRATRRTTRKTTTKTGAKKTGAKKTGAKKTPAKKSGTKAPVRKAAGQKKTAPATTATSGTQDGARAAAGFNREDLGERQRVYSLAKKLGITSKDLIVALDAVGLVKVAQSSLTREEMNRVLDHLEQKSSPAAPQAEEPAAPQAPEQEAGTAEKSAPESAPEGESEERIRTRVRKNVDNEIHQIEAKVDAELAVATGESESGTGDGDAQESAPAEPEAAEDDAAEDGAAEDTEDQEALVDVLPGTTPAPKEASATAAYAPVFVAPGSESEDGDEDSPGGRRRRSSRRATRRSSVGKQETAELEPVADSETDQTEDQPQEDLPEEPVALKGSTRLEAQKRRRTEMREAGRKKAPIVSQAEFLARRESVARTMVVRERHHVEDPSNPALITQVAVLEDDLLVEHFVTSEAQASMIGNIYLGRVQNVLPSMEAAFIDIGKGRNGVLYASEVDWKSAGLKGGRRRIEQALKSGDQVLVQVSKDPLGHKGARLTTQISLAGRYLVYVPGGRSAGISRKLPAPERKRLKDILNRVIPGEGGAIIRTAAENVPEEAIAADVDRLHTLWEDLQARTAKEKSAKGSTPVTLYEEPDMLVKVVRDLFNEDFTSLVVDGRRAWNTVKAYVDSVAPDLSERLERYDRRDHDGHDAFARHRIDEQLQKALGRKVWLPSGGSLVIDRTEAMTVIDVNTGKFTGSGGNLEETVTRNNLEAAEEIVRQLRLRDIGGMIVVDFIDMVLPENQDLVLRRLKEALGRDRTRHQVSEVTSLGLVQMTRKRLGTGLLETFSTTCEACAGRGLILHEDPVDPNEAEEAKAYSRKHKHNRNKGRGHSPAPASRREEPAATPSRPNETDFEELAASVVREEEPATGTDTGTSTDTDTGGRSRRRGGRGRGRGRGGRQEQQPQQQKPQQQKQQRQEEPASSSVDEVEAIAAAATARANEAEPEETVATTVAGTQSYDQALAEFEASPRRRRDTRGNSRSDHRPKREDFAEETVEEKKQEAKVEAAQRAEPKPPRAGSGRRSGGRRSARATTTPKQEAPSQPTEKKAASNTGARRGRRRAVRRLSTERQPQAAQETKQPTSAAQPKETPAKEQQASTSGRRRRRATRKSRS